jgi:hypothetical protein
MLKATKPHGVGTFNITSNSRSSFHVINIFLSSRSMQADQLPLQQLASAICSSCDSVTLEHEGGI